MWPAVDACGPALLHPISRSEGDKSINSSGLSAYLPVGVVRY